MLYMTLDIATICHQQDLDSEVAAQAYFSIGGQLNLAWLLQTLDEFEATDSWSERMRLGLESEIYLHLRELVTSALAEDGAAAVEPRIAAWLEQHRRPVGRLATVLAELQAVQQPSLPMLAVAVQELRQLVQQSLGLTGA